MSEGVGHLTSVVAVGSTPSAASRNHFLSAGLIRCNSKAPKESSHYRSTTIVTGIAISSEDELSANLQTLHQQRTYRIQVFPGPPEKPHDALFTKLAH